MLPELLPFELVDAVLLVVAAFVLLSTELALFLLVVDVEALVDGFDEAALEDDAVAVFADGPATKEVNAAESSFFRLAGGSTTSPAVII